MLDKSLIENLERVDPDRYRAALFADKADKDALMVLYAFHAELAKVPEIVSEPMIGAIRYQWWRDALEEIYSDKPVRQHEVVTPLKELIEARDIPRYWLDRLINGRERDLDPTPFPNLEAARAYAKDTSGVLMQIAAHILDPDTDMEPVASLGEVWGLTGLARSWKYYHNRVLSELSFSDLVADTLDSYVSAKSSIGKVPAKIMPAISYAALTSGFLKPMQAKDYDPKSDMSNYGSLRKRFKLMGTVISGRV